MIDQSGSMIENVLYDNRMVPKSEAVASIANALIRELVNRCRREEGINDYYDIAVVGYSGDGVVNMLGGNDFMKPSALASRFLYRRRTTSERLMPSGRTTLITTEQEWWIEPKSVGRTPMYEAFGLVLSMLEGWCRDERHSRSYPPTVFNITDGEASDAGPAKLLDITDRVRGLSTDDGNVLLFNIHLCGSDFLDESSSVLFPSSADELPEKRRCRLMYDMSSVMPSLYNDSVVELRGSGVQPPFRGMGYNCSMNNLVSMMNIGSLSVTMI